MKTNNLPDTVDHPQHYASGKVECIDALEAIASTHTDPVAALHTCMIVKYLWRWHLKNGAEDLDKANWYLKSLTEYYSNKIGNEDF